MVQDTRANTFAKEPEAVWWQTVTTSLLFLNWKKERPASCDRHFPPRQGRGSSPLEGSECASPWFIIASCINVILWRFFYSKVYLLDSWVNTILGGKVGPQFYSMCQSWAPGYILCCCFITSPKALAVGKAWAVALCIRNGNPATEWCSGNLKAIIFPTLPLCTFILFGNAQGHRWTKINRLALDWLFCLLSYQLWVLLAPR